MLPRSSAAPAAGAPAVAAADPPSRPPVPSVRGRAARLALAWGLLFLASPGVLASGGSALLAALAVGLWGFTAAVPLGARPVRAVAVEWLLGGLSGAALMLWIRFVVPVGLVPLTLVWGAYAALAGVLLRALAGRAPFPLAVALAFGAGEGLRAALKPPFGLGWIRLGHFAHDDLWLSAGARVLGVAGVGFALAALAGGLAAFARRRALSWRELAAALLPAGLVALAGLASAPPPTVDGPRVLLVQPGFSQERKQHDDASANFRAARSLSLAALARAREAGEALPDLVCWGETMLYLRLFEDGVAEALEGGLAVEEWQGPLSADDVRDWGSLEDRWVRRGLFGRDADGRLVRGIDAAERFPDGTAFVAGAEVTGVRDGRLVRRNAVVLYDGVGGREGLASKRFLVIGAETMLGFERYAFVRRAIDALAGYVPDFTPAEETGVLSFTARTGRTYRFGASVCFDNAFLEPYVEAAAAGPLDFHLVVSNEAWYRTSFEMDQMVAFSRLIALATGRSIVRATNSGVSLVIDPEGRELGRVRSGERDRAVAGTLTLAVPVPAAGEQPATTARTTVFTRWASLVEGLFIALPVLLALLVRRSRRARGYRPELGG